MVHTIRIEFRLMDIVIIRFISFKALINTNLFIIILEFINIIDSHSHLSTIITLK